MCPRDRALGMHATSLSPGVLRMVGLAASDFSFAAASDLLWELAAVRVETKQVERAAEALGREVAADERAVAETVPSPAPTMYLGLDGTGVPVRPAEVEGRRGKQPDGSAKTREVKLATVWRAERRDKAGRPVRDRGSVSYNAAVESAASRDTDPQPSAFAQRVHREAHGAPSTPRHAKSSSATAPPGSGICRPGSFPAAIEIVDIYHAKQHLCDVAKALYGAGTDLANQWAKDRRAELDAGRLRALVAALRIHVETTPEARKCIHYVLGEPPPHALSAVPRQGPVRLVGRRRGRMQADRGPAQARRHALDRRRGQRHHRPALLHSQRTLRVLLGATRPQTPPEGRLTMMSCTLVSHTC